MESSLHSGLRIEKAFLGLLRILEKQFLVAFLVHFDTDLSYFQGMGSYLRFTALQVRGASKVELIHNNFELGAMISSPKQKGGLLINIKDKL